MKRTWFQAQFKQDIAINTQNEHERHYTHKRGIYSIFTKESHPQAYISQSYHEHNYTSHEHHKQGHYLISSISWWTKHIEKYISNAYVTNTAYDTKMQAWYDTYMEMQHAYVHLPSQPKLKNEKQLQALLANEQM
jgi:hypothetical protein